jgi:gluconate 5-dehydrogenase
MSLPSLEKYFALNGKTALVTGSSSGIGRALATGLAGAGATVMVHGRSEEQLAETQREIAALGGTSQAIVAELNDQANYKRLIEQSQERLGRLDILVNCAGMNRRKPIEEVNEADFDLVMNVNLRSVYFLSQAVHPIMRAQGGGKIVHVASLTTFMGIGKTSIYGITKSALAQLAKTQAVEWARDNIQVNCLAPGFIVTPLTEQSLWQDEKKSGWMLGRIPARRPGKPDEMVAAVLFMAGPGSSYLTGQTISVDGGVLAGGSWDD